MVIYKDLPLNKFFIIMRHLNFKAGFAWLLAWRKRQKHNSSPMQPDTETQRMFSLFRNRHYSPRELRSIRNTAVAAHLTLKMALKEREVEDAEYFVKKAEKYCQKIINKMQ